MKRHMVLFVMAVLGSALLAWPVAQTCAQTKEKGPWWPHPLWGAADQAGGSNWITPAKILESLKLVKTGKTYELGQIYERGMPLFGQRTFAIFASQSGPSGKNNLMGHDDFLCTEIGQVGTQFDGPGHIGMRMTMADSSVKDVYYNGFTVQDDMGGDRYGLKKLGVEHIKPYITRGILIDIAGYKGQETLPNSYEVTVADVQGALQKQSIAEASIKEGDALFFNYGWSKLWKEPAKYNVNPPGIGLEVAKWVIDKKAAMVGSDSWPTEVWPNPNPDLRAPVHQELITKNGILNLENMVFEDLIKDSAYEFLFVFTPIRFKGATGSPARPLAIR
jgi:kynurenine formamidase